MFAELGRAGGEFPGHPWDIQRQMLWIFNEVDPDWNARAEAGRPIDPSEFVAGFVPRYFTLNGRSGCDSAHARDTHPEGKIGEPMLLRTMNAGAMVHGPHVHGNHVLVLTLDGRVLRDVWKKETFVIEPAQRVDVLLPYIQPPDIPDEAWPPRQELTLEEFRRNVHDPGRLTFPMHPHNELSQTAAGGNYPLGMITDWTINF